MRASSLGLNMVIYFYLKKSVSSFFLVLFIYLCWQPNLIWLLEKEEGKKERKEKKNSPCLHPKFEFATDVESRLSNLEGGSNVLIFKVWSEEKGIFGQLA